jgi:hypothetical protein
MYRPELTKLTKQFKHGKMSPNFFFPFFFWFIHVMKNTRDVAEAFRNWNPAQTLEKERDFNWNTIASDFVRWGCWSAPLNTCCFLMSLKTAIFIFIFILFYFILFYKNKNKIQVAVLCCSFMSEYDIRKVVIPFTLSSLSFSLINSDNDAYGSWLFLPGIFGCCWPTCNH